MTGDYATFRLHVLHCYQVWYKEKVKFDGYFAKKTKPRTYKRTQFKMQKTTSGAGYWRSSFKDTCC